MHNNYYAVQVDENEEKSEGKETDLRLIISGEENNSFSSLYFGVIDFTFENKSQHWIRIKSITVDFGAEEIDKNVSLTSGIDLVSWNDSIMKREIIKTHNTEMVMGSITAFGAATAIASDNDNLKKMGALTTAVGVTSYSVYKLNKMKNEVEKSLIFPKNHLLAEDFTIPPGLFIKKWLLVNTKNHSEIGYLVSLYLKYETEEGKTETVELRFRPRRTPTAISKWQSDAPNKNGSNGRSRVQINAGE